MIELRNVSFSYPDTGEKILDNLSVIIPPGSFVAVVGDNGAGKSTFCKLLNGIIPNFLDGDLQGEIRIWDQAISEKTPAELAHTIGYVYQDFENQLIRPRVLDDASYGLLNEGEERYEEITMEILRTLDLAHVSDEYVWQLSGGQKHLLALAGVLVMSPKIIVLDEPIAQLDPTHAGKIYDNLAFLNQKLGKTIVVIEHNSEYISRYCDQVLFMKNRQIEWLLPVKEAFQQVLQLIEGGVYPPQITLLGHGLSEKGYDSSGDLPISIDEGIGYINRRFDMSRSRQIPSDLKRNQAKGKSIVEMKEVSLSYKKIDQGAYSALNNLNLTLHAGERIALIGNNGAGKSSMLKMLIGLLKPDSGQIVLDGQNTKKMKMERISDKVGYVYQNPENMFIEDSIEKDIAFSLKARGIKNYKNITEQLLQQFNLMDIRQRDGRLLSGGQMRRASLAIGVSLNPKVLLLDEPTASLDMATRKRITHTLKEVADTVETIVIATHDMQLVAEWANRVIVLHDGQVIGDGSREEIFADEKLLQRAGIVAPEIVQLSQRLNGRICYSIQEFLDYLEKEAVLFV